MNTESCKSCGAAVLWCRTEKGKLMPVDATPLVDGNLVIEDGTVRVLKQGELFIGDQPRYQSHYASCPQAASWRKAK